MSDVRTIPTSVSALLGVTVVDASGAKLGRVRDLAIDVLKDGTQVAGLVLRNPHMGGKDLLLPMSDVKPPQPNVTTLEATAQPELLKRPHEFLLLDFDLLDQQIIDVDGRKVVRVNDVDLAWQGNGAPGSTRLSIEDVEVGNRGAIRRLLKGLPAAAVENFTGKMKPRIIPWNCVDLIERDPARRVRLKIGRERLAKLHPSDIAEILEELAPAEREAVFSSLPEETAAETLEEFEPKMQKELVQRMDSERAADIIEEMDPGAAADLLSELSDEESEAILDEMEPEERHDVEELLEFEHNTAAGQMTTDFLSVPNEATVGEAIEALRTFEGDPDTITEVYLTDAEEKLLGVVMLPRLILAKPETTLSSLWEGHIVSCPLNASHKQVAELFDKYNLRSLPVVDHKGHLAGAIHAEQVIAQLREA
jgi:CBS domain-containing protein/sporulation protein YlmC with PRC-barrel domain